MSLSVSTFAGVESITAVIAALQNYSAKGAAHALAKRERADSKESKKAGIYGRW